VGSRPAPHSCVPALMWLGLCELPAGAGGAGSKVGVRSAKWGATGTFYGYDSFTDFALSLSTFDAFS